MKYFKRLNLYKSSNLTFNPAIVSAHSYKWWEFVRCIGKTIVFNEYRYSVSTAKHQAKVRQLFNELGIVPDLKVNVRESLDTFSSIKELIKRSDETTKQQQIQKIQKRKDAYIRQRVKKLNAQGLYTSKQWHLLNQGYTTSCAYMLETK